MYKTEFSEDVSEDLWLGVFFRPLSLSLTRFLRFG
jgi:hypothetical protein